MRLRRRFEDDGGLVLTPLIDMVFLVVIFFMLNTSLSINPAITVELAVDNRMLNLTLFADIGPETTLGLETNVAAHALDETAVLLMPQLHQEFADHFMVQAGAGAEFSPGETVPLLGIRAIYTF